MYIHTSVIDAAIRCETCCDAAEVSMQKTMASILNCTVSFHNFKSQNFKLSVSNPKSKYVADLSVLSQIANCQSLGRKNKHEILKTDRTPKIMFYIMITVL